MLVEYVIRPLLLILPVAIAGIMHMLAVRFNLFPLLKKPMNRKLFGQNKTYRGLVLMPLFSVMGVGFIYFGEKVFYPEGLLGLVKLSSFQIVSLGFCLGLGYIFAELPNSWMKRRLGIAEGQLPENSRFYLFFLLLDQADSAIGCLIIYAFFLNISIMMFLMSFIWGIVIHLLFNFLLYLAGIRKRPC